LAAHSDPSLPRLTFHLSTLFIFFLSCPVKVPWSPFVHFDVRFSSTFASYSIHWCAKHSPNVDLTRSSTLPGPFFDGCAFFPPSIHLRDSALPFFWSPPLCTARISLPNPRRRLSFTSRLQQTCRRKFIDGFTLFRQKKCLPFHPVCFSPN